MLYLGDNGRCLCGEHLGSSAYYSGRDLSGQSLLPVTPEVVREAEEDPALGGWVPSCEQCGREPSRLHLPGGVL